MKSKLNKIFIVSMLLVSICLSFFGGAFFGVNFGWKIYMPSLEKDLYGQAISNQVVLEKIDKNELQDGHEHLVMMLNGQIHSISSLVEDEENIEAKTKMEKLLKRIAIHREKYPDLYSSEVKNDQYKEANQKLAEILNKYK